MIDQFDPIVFLRLEELNDKQTDKLRPAIEQNICLFIINSLINDLNDEKSSQLQKLLPIDKNFHDTLKAIYQIAPNFDDLKSRYLDNYFQLFRLQDFIQYIK